MDKFIELTNEVTLKQVLIHPNNEKTRKYFLETFLNINEKIASKKEEIFYKGILNHIDISSHGFTSDIIFKYDDFAIRINIYNTRNNDFIIHFLYGSVINEEGRLLELRFTKNQTYEKEIIEDNYLENSQDLSDNSLANYLLKIKTINLNRIKELDNNNAINRWLKFIASENNEERKKACKNDEVLTQFYNWLKE